MAAEFAFFPTDVSFRVRNNKTVIYIYGRMPDGRRACVIDSSFNPFFYAKTESQQAIEELLRIRIKEGDNLYYVVSAEKVTKSLLGKDQVFYKISVNRPKSSSHIIGVLARQGIEIYEADLNLTEKYLIDRKIRMLTWYNVSGDEVTPEMVCDVCVENATLVKGEAVGVHPKVAAFSAKKLYRLDRKNNPVALITVVCGDYRASMTYLNVDYPGLIKVDSEPDLIAKFREVLASVSPDLIFGYNSDVLLRDIKHRARKYDIRVPFGLDRSEIRLNRRYRSANIIGIPHIDLKRFISLSIGDLLEEEDYDLSYIAQELLGEERKEADDDLVNSLKDPEKLSLHIKEAERDAELASDLSMEVLSYLFDISGIAYCSLAKLSRLTRTQILEEVVKEIASGSGEVILKKPATATVKERSRRRAKEVFLFADPGIYENCGIFSFRKKVPHLVADRNISPDTLNFECDEKEYIAEGIWTCRSRQGLFSKACARLLHGNDKGHESNDICERIASNILDYSESPYSRWHSVQVGDAVRKIWSVMSDALKSKAATTGARIIYQDEEIMVFQFSGQEGYLNFSAEADAASPDSVPSDFFERLYVPLKRKDKPASDWIIFVRDGKVHEINRKHYRASAWSLEARSKVLAMIPGAGRDQVIGYLQEKIKDIRDHRVPLNDLILKTKLRRRPERYEGSAPYIAAAKMLQAREVIVERGSTIGYIVVKGESARISERVKLPDECSPADYDPEYYIKKQLLQVLSPVLSLLGITEEDILQDRDQTKLEGFI